MRSGLTEWHDDANDFETCLVKFSKVTMKFILYGYFKRWALQRGIALTKTAKDDPKGKWSSRSGSSVADVDDLTVSMRGSVEFPI